jgi:hypothetical protein
MPEIKEVWVCPSCSKRREMYVEAVMVDCSRSEKGVDHKPTHCKKEEA